MFHADVQFVLARILRVVLDAGLMALATKPAAVRRRGGRNVRRARNAEHRNHEGQRLHQVLGQLFARAVLSSAARSPLASLIASSFAQKCMKMRRGCSSSMWLWIAVTSMPPARNSLITGLTSSPVSTKSPVIAALPPPVGWKLMPVATPIGPAGVRSIPPS